MAEKPKKTDEAARYILPEDFIPHYGGGRPVDAEQYVEAIIRTAEGYGSTGVQKAKYHDWTFEAHEPEGGLGEVVGYRLAGRNEAARYSPTERF